MKKRFQSCCLWLLLALVALSCSRKEAGLFDAIPADSEVFVETADVKTFLGELNGKSYMEPLLKADSDVAWVCQLLPHLDSLLQKDQSLYARFVASPMAFVSVPTEEESHGLFLVKAKVTESELKRFLNNNAIACDFRKNGSTEYYYLKDLDSLFVFVKEPFVGLSRNVNVIEKVFQQLRRSSKIDSNGDLPRLQKTLGRHVKAHLYYHDDRGWAALDILPGREEVMMNGYCVATDTTSSLKPLKYQLPIKNSIVNLLPYNTQFMLHYGMSDYASYWQSFRDVDAVTAFNKRYGLDVETQFLNYLSEVSFNVINEKRQEAFVARMNDPAAVIGFMERLASSIGGGVTENYQGYAICDLGEKNLLPEVFGARFKTITRCCYAIVDQYLLITPSMGIMREIISCYRSGRTLDLNENFKDFQQRMLESCNVTLFATGTGNQTLVKQLFTGPLAQYLNDHPNILDSFRVLVVQLASSKDLVYVNACLLNNAQTKDESSVRWKVNLDAPLKGKPFIVEDGESRYVIAFDSQNVMNFINKEGQILWKKAFDEPPLGEVFAIDNNGQVQFLFNTAHTIQLIDREGNNVDGYPVRLPFEASNGLAVFDYNNNKDYRILVCGTDRLVYNYDVHGEEVEGWNRHRAEDQVKQPVKHLVANDKDYLIVSDVSGGVRILDRQGRIRIPLSSATQKSPQADIYANVTNRNKGLFLTSDKEGKLLYVKEDGALNKTDFGTYSDQHFFLYEDFNGDKDPDFIYLDQKELYVFDRFKNELFRYHFDVEINTKPVFFAVTRNKRLLGIVSEKAREIYLIDRKGKMIVNAGLVGETPFAVGSLQNDQEINLVTGVGNALFNYTIR